MIKKRTKMLQVFSLACLAAGVNFFFWAAPLAIRAQEEKPPFEVPKEWIKDWDAALGAAGPNKQSILGFFGSTTCDSCRTVFENLTNDSSLQDEVKKRTVFFGDDIDAGVRNRFHITSSPTLILFSPEGNEEDRLPGVHPPPILVKFLKEQKTHAARVQEIKSKIEKEPRNAAFYRELGDVYVNRPFFDFPASPTPALVLKAYRKAIELDPSLKDKLADRIYFYEAISIDPNPDKAALDAMGAKLEKFETLFPKSSLLPRIPLHRFEAFLQQENHPDVIAYMKKALDRFPNEDMASYYRMIIDFFQKQTH